MEEEMLMKPGSLAKVFKPISEMKHETRVPTVTETAEEKNVMLASKGQPVLKMLFSTAKIWPEKPCVQEAARQAGAG